MQESVLRGAVLDHQAEALPLVAWVGATWSGVETQFRNVLRLAEEDRRIRSLAVPIEGFRDDAIERWLPFLPKSTRATLREAGQTLPLYRRSQVSAVWTQLTLPLLPWLLTAAAWRKTPVVYSTDATLRQLHRFGPLYDYWGGRTSARFGVRDALERLFLQRMTLITPWSEWAARSMREDYGVPADRLRVLPPGIDLGWWRPRPDARGADRVPRALFVGGDFERKGGELLLQVYRERFRGRLELDLVTRAGIDGEPGVRVHRGLGPNDPRLLALYQTADLLVLPTRADCFSLAAVEALACGLPVILGRTGGAAEVLEDGVQGYYVEPQNSEELAAAMERVVADPFRRTRMGRAARLLAERRYDGHRNTEQLVGWLHQLTQRPPP